MERTGARYRSFSSAELAAPPDRVGCRVVAGEAERALHLAVRHAVFVEEQGLFSGSDADERDQDPATLHVLGFWAGEVAGAVRLYPLAETGRWKGDRLAVLSPFRRHGIGAPLVRFAVRTAAQLGGSMMVAQIQPANVPFFERLGWYRAGDPAPYVGRLHQRMAIDLQPGSPQPRHRLPVKVDQQLLPPPEPGADRAGGVEQPDLLAGQPSGGEGVAAGPHL
jgi:putative N-acetyltransferase (TIGR04045 family)